nr:nucleotide pyrophosphatase/phosphodiesterase family protein [Garicola koreensis]
MRRAALCARFAGPASITRAEPVGTPSAPDYDGAHLRHVLTSAAAALGVGGFSNQLNLPESSITVVILADGLGDQNLAGHTGHARFLSRPWRSAQQGRSLDTGAPTTTAASLTSLGTGLTPGEHGMVGYDVFAPHLGRVVNMLGSWDAEVDPISWQPEPTVLGAAEASGTEVLTVSRPQFRDSPLTRAALRGGQFAGSSTIAGRFGLAADWIAGHRPRTATLRRGPMPKLLVYLYIDELDKTGHNLGVGSAKWVTMLENVDAAAAQFSRQLKERFGAQASVLLTADHGMINVAQQNRIDISERADLLRSVRHTGGEPRMVQLYTEPGAAEQVRSVWQQEFGDLVWAVTAEEALAAGWFGPVRAGVRPRIGDVLIAARQEAAIFHTDRTGTQPLSMVGQHGSLTEAERRVPLLELTGRGFAD